MFTIFILIQYFFPSIKYNNEIFNVNKLIFSLILCLVGGKQKSQFSIGIILNYNTQYNIKMYNYMSQCFAKSTPKF